MAVREPLCPGKPLTPRTVAIPAGVIGDALIAAVAAALYVAAECRGATTLDRQHGAPPRAGQRGAMLVAESWTEAAERIRHFQPLASQGV